MYHKGLRDIVTKRWEKTKDSVRALAALYQVSKTTVHRWITAPLKKSEAKDKARKVTQEVRKKIREYVVSHIFVTLQDIRDWLKSNCKISLSRSWIHKIIKEEKISFKKTTIKVDNIRTNDTLRKQFRKKIKKNIWDKIVCIDETGFKLGMFPIYGWAPKGKRIISTTPKDYSHRFCSAIYAINKKEIMSYTLFKGSCNKAIFLEFINSLKLSKNIVIMDNVRFHHSKEIKEAIEATGSKIVYTVPYSPELNPIEEMFSKLKHMVRKEKNMSQVQLYTAVNKANSLITKEDLLGYFSHAFSK